MNKFTEFFWPVLKRESDEEKCELKKNCNKDIKKIEHAHWDPIDPVLEQARILDLREEERNRIAETKAAIYIAALVALAPLSVTLIMDFFNLFQNKELVILIVSFILVMVYIVRAFFICTQSDTSWSRT